MNLPSFTWPPTRRVRFLAASAAIFAVVIAAAIYFYPHVTKKNEEVTPGNIVTEVPVFAVPKDFPVEIPMETNIKILTNYNAVNPAGRLQATRSFESKRTVEENAAFYQKYFSKNDAGWALEDELNIDDAPRTLFGTSSKGKVIITIAPAGGNRSIVDISFVARPTSTTP